MIGVIWNEANILRFFILGECLLCMGFFLQRLWASRGNLGGYLPLMGFALFFFSVYSFAITYAHLDHPLPWRSPLLFVAVTLAAIAIVKG